MRERQRGVAGLFIAVLLILIIGGILGTLAFLRSRGQGDRAIQSDRNFDAVKTSLIQFVAANGRLPCPANPALPPADANVGVEMATGAAGTCDFPLGTVPWQTIGVRRDDSFDTAGWKISYRVYTGNKGSLTQAGGASMVDCEPAIPATAEIWPASRTPVTGVSGGLCRALRDTTDTQFLVDKGLAINHFGTAVTDAAFVLISHGPSGLGSWTSNGTQTALPVSANELTNATNTNSAVPLIAKGRSAPTVGPSDAEHFDDVLAYQTVKELIRIAGRGPRDWPETTAMADETLNAAGLAAAIGTAPTAGSDLGTTSLFFDTARVTGLSGGTATNLTFDSSSGTEGLGVSGSGTGITSAINESVRVELRNKATKFAVSLGDFATVNFFWTWKEQASFQFYNAGTLVFTSPDKESCHAGAFASFSFDLGATEFDRVDIVPKIAPSNTIPFFGTGPSIATSFLLSGFKSCTALPCQTALQVASPSLTCT